MASPSYPPPSRPRTDWARVALYGGIAGGVLLGGYGVYTLLNNLSGGGGNPGAGLSVCEQNYQTAFNAYTAQYKAYVKQNGGAPPTTAQENSLTGYTNAMNTAETCVQSEANYSITAWTSFLTNVALLAAGSLTVIYAYKNYLKYRGGQVSSGTEARQAIRNSVAQTEVEDGTMSPADGAANVAQSRNVAATEAEAENSALGSVASTDLAEATAAGDIGLVDNIQLFVSDAIDTIYTYAAEVYDYFVGILG